MGRVSGINPPGAASRRYAAACSAQSRYRRQYAPSGLEQLVVRALLDDPAVLEHDDAPARAWIVDSRWAITIAVRPASSRRRPSSIRLSVWMSTFEVASSSTRIRGSAISARAKAMSWRWPAESCAPRSPTSVS